MAKVQAVWGIDIGNTSLKALRCVLSEESGKIEALACDFIEHSKILSQPGVDSSEILAETLQTFLSRNSLKGDRIAISVSGQNTISRFLPLPPVDPKKIPDVIRYEAKNWLPFDINEVVFDFQVLGNPQRDSDGMLMDATVGMFAIKRDAAAKAIAPYLSRSVDVDSIQSSPIALYNCIAFDQLLPIEESEEEVPQESLIALCIGTDATDVVITNGEKIWIRNIPLGGNSFTKALTRELHLTYSKAEYLKRNIGNSKDVDEQKRVITAMRPVFNDMVNEVNRSLEYYLTLNRQAKFQKIIAMGNASKLPGLRQFIAQNLGYEVSRVNRFNRFVGNEVIETQLFKDNLHSFGVCYGLVIQQLGVAPLATNLVPRDVVFDRIIREKKPWILTAAAALLLGITVQYTGVTSAYNSVFNAAYESAESKAKSVQTFAADLQSKKTQALTDYGYIDGIGKNLTSNVEGRILWLEILRAINAALPQSQHGANVSPAPFTDESFAKADRIFIENIEAIPIVSQTDWFAPLKNNKRYYPDDEELTGYVPPDTGSSTEGVPTSPARLPLSEEERFLQVIGPTDASAMLGAGGSSYGGSGYSSYDSSGGSGSASLGTPTAKVIQIIGYHYHNPREANEFAEDGGEAYLRKTFLRNLKFGTVELPTSLEEQQSGRKSETVSMKDLGIAFPTLLYVPNVVEQKMINPALLDPRTGKLPEFVEVDPQFLQGTTATSGGSMGRSSSRGGGGSGVGPSVMLSQYAMQRGVRLPILTVRRFDFVIQFAWKETTPSERSQTIGSIQNNSQQPF